MKQLGRHSEAEDVVKEIVARDPSFLDRNTDWSELKMFREAGDPEDQTRD